MLADNSVFTHHPVAVLASANTSPPPWARATSQSWSTVVYHVVDRKNDRVERTVNIERLLNAVGHRSGLLSVLTRAFLNGNPNPVASARQSPLRA